MKKSEGMQLGAVLVAMLLLSMAFVPAVNASAATELAQTNDVGQLVNTLWDGFGIGNP